MAQLLTRAQTRDASRRDMGITPPCDYPVGDARHGAPGAQPVGNPVPSNAQLNDAYDSAISLLNAHVEYSSIVLPLNLPPSTATGYLPISMTSNPYLTKDVMAHIGLQNLNDVRRVGWINGGDSQYQQVFPMDIAQRDRDRIIYDNNGPGIPQYYYTDQFNLYITPPNATQGVLEVTYGNGSLSFTSDGGYIEQLPTDHHQAVRVIANKLVTMKGTGNVEWNALFQMLTPLEQIWVSLVEKWYATNNRAEQPQAGAVDMRRDWGTYKRRRR